MAPTQDENAEDRFFLALSSQSLEALTPGSLERALDGFALSLFHKGNFEWLAMALRRALAIAVFPDSLRATRVSNADIRNELEKLATLARSTWAAAAQCSQAVEHRLWSASYEGWDGMNPLLAHQDPNFLLNRYHRALNELDWLGRFLDNTAKKTENQPPNWRIKSEKDLRVLRGIFLASVFESAFGVAITVNNWPNPQHKNPTPFMDFYQRVVGLAFGENATPNLAGVLKEAQALHRESPVEFSQDVIPAPLVGRV